MKKFKNLIRKASVLTIFTLFMIGAFSTSINSSEIVKLNKTKLNFENVKFLEKLDEIVVLLEDPDTWWDSDWSYRKMITIDHDSVDGNLNNFPVLISVTDGDIAEKAQCDGNDIAFTDINDIQLDHEVEYYDDTTGELICWVNIGSLSSTEDIIIYIYYGNDECGSQENIEGVWNSNYVLVQHLEETSGTHYDSTSNDNDGTQNGGVDQDASGIVDGADSFDGSDDYVDVPDDTSLNFGTNDFTVEGWINTPSLTNGYSRIVCKQTSTTEGYCFYIRQTDGALRFNRGGSYGSPDTPIDVVDGEWHHVAVVLDGSNVYFYVDGVLDGILNLNTNDVSTTTDFAIGGDSGGGDYPFQGSLDEIRLSNIARSSEWISTTYNTINAPDDFFSFGEEEVYPPNYRPNITSPDPANNSIEIDVGLGELSVTIEDPEGDSFDWTIDTSPDVGSASGTDESNGTKTCDLEVLDYGTTYTWTVTATDSDGSEETATEIYSFTTIVNESTIIFNPDPVDGFVGVTVLIDELTVTIQDPEGDNFDWDIYTSPYIGSASGTDESNGTKVCDISGLDYDTTYTWMVSAMDTDGSGELVQEVYTFTTEIYNEPPNTPSEPDGPTDLEIGEYGEFCTEATDPDGNHIQYKFDWGDGSYSDWSDLVDSGEEYCTENAWGLSGEYEVRVQVRDEHGKYSDWSDPLTVEVTGENNPPDIPNKPIGVPSLHVGEVGQYCTSAIDPDENMVQYKFDWGDGNFSDWTDLVESGVIDCMNYSWINPGTYNVTAIVRDEYTALSENWSEIKTVTVLPAVQDLDCVGQLSWPGVKAAAKVTGTFSVKNVGQPLSKLDWEIVDWPDWGEWEFNPISGENLTPEGDSIEVQVTVTAPNETTTKFDGKIRIENKEDSNDYCRIDVSLTTPRNQNFHSNLLIQIIKRLFCIFPFIQQFF